MRRLLKWSRRLGRRLSVRLDESRPSSSGMVLRAGEWKLPSDGTVCGAAFGDGSSGESGFAICGGSSQDFLARRPKRSRFALPTRLTQARRSHAKAGNLATSVPVVPRTRPRCPVCGAAVTTGSTYCAKCVPAVNRENLLKQATLGRIATHSAIAEARRAATHAKHVEALRKWKSFRPAEVARRRDVQACDFAASREIHSEGDSPQARRISSTLIKRGLKIPHPRYWMPLAELAGYQQ